MTADPKKEVRVAVLLAGRIDDGGFMEAGYRGLMRAEEQFGLAVHHIDGIPLDRPLLAQALRQLASSGAPLVIAHGGQNNEAAQAIAAEFPAVRFAVTQGNVRGANLASYDVLQEQSAWLAGAAAGLLTRSGIVGHISGIRVVPGLKGRAAFAAGLKASNPAARLLTTFCGTQDDEEVAYRVASAEAKEGADIVFTMLNAGMPGAIKACRDHGIRQIGNVRDWTTVNPDVFVGSAIADVGFAVFSACHDFVQGAWRDGAIHRIGLEDGAAVRLALARDIPESVEARVQKYRAAIVAREIEIPETYDGPEFQPR